MTIPFITIGNNEIEQLPELGVDVNCWICGSRHEVEYGDIVNKDGTKTPSRMLAFFNCGDKTYLCGVNGKEWRPE